MKVKVSKLLEWLNNQKEEYIDVEILEYLSYPRINNIEQVITGFETLIERGKKESSKSELSRKIGKSRVTIDEWIKTGVLVTKQGKICLEESCTILKELYRLRGIRSFLGI